MFKKASIKTPGGASVMKGLRAIKVSIYTALVFVATIILQVYTPATRGYFNLGEAAIYSIAIIASPIEAAIAGGVGSALADLLTGYGYFAPGTLIIKAIEGFAVSYLAHRLIKYSQKVVKGVSVVISIATGIIIATVGYLKLSGVSEITSIPIDIFGIQTTVLSTSISISKALWIFVGIVITAVLLYASLVKGKENLTLAASMLIGVLIMPLGYFLYEYFYSNPIVLGLPAEQAFVEIPVNIGQALVGLGIALPITSFLREAGGLEE